MVSLFEPLEPRQLLHSSPLPTLEMLEDPSHAVIRVETRLGAFDVELFTSDQGITVDSVLTLLRAGRYGDTLIHSLAMQAGAGGAFRTMYAGRYLPDPILGAVPAESPEPPHTFGWPTHLYINRPPVAGTLAVPILPRNITYTYGTLIINVDDYAIPPAEIRVFGRVIQGWDVILEIADLEVVNPREVFEQFPSTGTPVVPGEEPLFDRFITLSDVQIIKPEGIPAFYEHQLYYPEGFSWQRIEQSLELLNPGAADSHYQVIVRYERGQRDKVIAEGQLDAGARRTTIISAANALSTIVRNGEPYSLEVWSTAPLAASLRHSDFGRATRESFFNPGMLPRDTLMHAWTFSHIAPASGQSDVFLLWLNTTSETTTITLTLYFADREPMDWTYTLGAHRRGGVNIHHLPGLGAAPNFAAARVAADAPIVASMSRYDRSHLLSSTEGGLSILGTFGGGATIGAAPGLWRSTLDTVTILNTTDAPVTITFAVVSRPGSRIEMQITTPARGILALSGSTSPVALATSGRGYMLEYTADAPVTVGLVHSASRSTGAPLSIWSSREIHFADASPYIPSSQTSPGRTAAAVHRPANSAPGSQAVTIRFWFGTSSPTFTPFLLAPGETREHDLSFTISNPQLAARHGLSIISLEPVIAQLRQFTLQGPTQRHLGVAETGTPLSPITIMGITAI